jgi:predicted amidohydrolase YtcJ
VGARVEAWHGARWPTLAELDSAAGAACCVIRSFDHHAGVANSAALRAAGLRPGMRVPPNGEVVADAGGRATGLLAEQAAWAAWSAAPEPTYEERIGHLRAGVEHLHRLGFIEVHDMFSQEWLGPGLARLEGDGALPVRVWLYAPVEAAGAFETRAWESERVRFAGLKAFADGTLNSRTALMLSPYEGSDGWRGKAMMTEGELDAAMERAAGMGAGLAVHAIGDAAVRMVLDAWEARGRCAPLAANGTPSLRVEHAELIDGADVPRFARLGVTCSVQPCHLLYDIEVLRRALPDRLERVLPLRELIDSGCRPGELLWFGSDAPVVPADPMDSVNAALRRRRDGMAEREAIAWGQRIEAPEAWAAFCARESR